MEGRGGMQPWEPQSTQKTLRKDGAKELLREEGACSSRQLLLPGCWPPALHLWWFPWFLENSGDWDTALPPQAHIFLGLLRAVILPAAPPPIRSRWKLTTNNYAGLCFILEWNYSVYIGLYRPIFLSLPPVPSPLLPGIPSERKFVSWKRGPGEKEEGEKNEVCVHVFVTSICSQK